jgi:hypothetical protein
MKKQSRAPVAKKPKAREDFNQAAFQLVRLVTREKPAKQSRKRRDS